jgi:hypothetical protein
MAAQITESSQQAQRRRTAFADLVRVEQKVQECGTAAARMRILNTVDYLRYLMNPTDMTETSIRSSVDRSALKTAVDALEAGRAGEPEAVLALVEAVRIALLRYAGE